MITMLTHTKVADIRVGCGERYGGGRCGVPALTQRLIHRGRVLKDDQRVDNARLTDGDTILLVQRPPDAPAARMAYEREHPRVFPRRRASGRGRTALQRDAQ